MYGYQLWDLGHTELKQFETVWRIIGVYGDCLLVLIKCFYHLSRMARVFFDAVIFRFYNFAFNYLYSSNTCVLFLTCNVGCSSLSFFGKYLIRLQMSESEVSIASSRVNLVCELIFCRRGYFHSVLSDAETELMLQDVCCN